MTGRTNRFQPLNGFHAPASSLHRLRTAFSPTRSYRSSSSSSSTGTTSPLTRTSSPDSHRSRHSMASMNSIRHLLALRRKPSVLDIEMEEEKHLFGREVEMLEPRPSGLGLNGGVEVGIFEVLEGH